jgi:hypothetical protein
MKKGIARLGSALALTLLLLTANYSYATAWEYLVKTYYLTGKNPQMSATFNKLGADRWELLNCTVEDAQLTCFFKRPVK